MCKIMAFTDLTDIKGLSNLVDSAYTNITKQDNDGFGWAALGVKGVFGERSIEKLYRYRLHRLSHNVKLPIVKEGLYEHFGTKSRIIGPAMFHGRTSTNDVNLLNTHPIVKNEWALIHNGVVTNQGPGYKTHTTNDTEHLVHYLSTGGMSAIENNVSGYYAFMAIDPFGQLHVVKDDIAPLYIAKAITLGCYVIGTTQELIESTCEAISVKVGPVDAIKDNQHLTFKNNELVSVVNIIPLGYGQKEASHMSRSMHHLQPSHISSHNTPSEQDGSWNGASIYNIPNIDSNNDDIVDVTLEVPLFLKECEYVDDTYTIYDYNNRKISCEEFRMFDDRTKLDCILVKPNGGWIMSECDNNDNILEKWA